MSGFFSHTPLLGVNTRKAKNKIRLEPPTRWKDPNANKNKEYLAESAMVWRVDTLPGNSKKYYKKHQQTPVENENH